jgi:hypothetical protein
MNHRRRTEVTAGSRRVQQGRVNLVIAAAIGWAMFASAIAWIASPTEGSAGDAPRFRGGARLAVDKELIELGTQPYNRVVEARFQLKNIGDRPLQLPPSPPVEVVEGC